jgi:hypothetical protein
MAENIPAAMRGDSPGSGFREGFPQFFVSRSLITALSEDLCRYKKAGTNGWWRRGRVEITSSIFSAGLYPVLV